MSNISIMVVTRYITEKEPLKYKDNDEMTPVVQLNARCGVRQDSEQNIYVIKYLD